MIIIIMFVLGRCAILKLGRISPSDVQGSAELQRVDDRTQPISLCGWDLEPKKQDFYSPWK